MNEVYEKRVAEVHDRYKAEILDIADKYEEEISQLQKQNAWLKNRIKEVKSQVRDEVSGELEARNKTANKLEDLLRRRDSKLERLMNEKTQLQFELNKLNLDLEQIERRHQTDLSKMEHFYKNQMDSEAQKWETELFSKETKIEELTSMVDSYRFDGVESNQIQGGART